MQNKFIFFQLMLLFVFSSCKNSTSATKANDKESQQALPINCYRYVEGRDTIALKLIHVGESITGTLAYYMPQKNTSKGTIQGHMDGDKLFAIFTPFVDSTTPRQIAFKLVQNHFIEGYGETYMENGQLMFRNRNALQFNDRNKLYEFKCQ